MRCSRAYHIQSALIVMVSVFAPIVVADAGSGDTLRGRVGRHGKAQIGKINGSAAAAIGVFRVTAATNTPKVGETWRYVVHAPGGRKAAAAKLTAEIVDPIGRKHAVGCGKKKGNVTDTAFTGTYKNFIVWPSESVGYPLTLRITVVSGGAEQVVDYKLTVHK